MSGWWEAACKPLSCPLKLVPMQGGVVLAGVLVAKLISLLCCFGKQLVIIYCVCLHGFVCLLACSTLFSV